MMDHIDGLTASCPRLYFMPEYLLQFFLQASTWHVNQEKQACRKEIYEPEKETGAICVFESHGCYR